MNAATTRGEEADAPGGRAAAPPRTGAPLLVLTADQAAQTRFPEGCPVVYRFRAPAPAATDARVGVVVAAALDPVRRSFAFRVARRRGRSPGGTVGSSVTDEVDEDDMAYSPGCPVMLAVGAEKMHASVAFAKPLFDPNGRVRGMRYIVEYATEENLIRTEEDVAPERLSFNAGNDERFGNALPKKASQQLGDRSKQVTSFHPSVVPMLSSSSIEGEEMSVVGHTDKMDGPSANKRGRSRTGQHVRQRKKIAKNTDDVVEAESMAVLTNADVIDAAMPSKGAATLVQLKQHCASSKSASKQQFEKGTYRERVILQAVENQITPITDKEANTEPEEPNEDVPMMTAYRSTKKVLKRNIQQKKTVSEMDSKPQPVCRVRQTKKKVNSANGGAKEVKSAIAMSSVAQNSETCLRDTMLALVPSDSYPMEVKKLIKVKVTVSGELISDSTKSDAAYVETSPITFRTTKSEEWQCTVCTYLNSERARKCKMCSANKRTIRSGERKCGGYTCLGQSEVAKTPSRRKQESSRVRQSKKKARTAEGGAKEIEGTAATGVGEDEKSCLRDAILVFAPSDQKRKELKDAIDEATEQKRNKTHNEGEPSPDLLEPALRVHGMVLNHVSRDYFHVEGVCRERAILQKTNSKLVLRLIIDSKNRKGVQYRHFVAWDGNIVHDSPTSLQVEESDRETNKRSKQAFGKLYKNYARWRITNVYELKTEEGRTDFID